jgi:hypothetical protein
MKLPITLGILMSTIGLTTENKENDVNTHSEHAAQYGEHHSGHEHQHKQSASQLMVASDPAEPVAGSPVTLRLMIHQADGSMVKDFDVVHEEKVHLVIVREGLDYFDHVHPNVDANGNLSLTHTFPVAGKYRLFADYAPKGGQHATATGSLSIGGKSEPAPKLSPNAPGEIESDGVVAAVSASSLKSGAPTRMTFALSDKSGNPVRLEKYMGELGHLMFVGVSSGEYVHVHPLGGDASKGLVEFQAHFTKPGLYKGWGQFKHDDRVRVIPLVVKVE